MFSFGAGAIVSSFCYLQFFPPPYDTDGMQCLRVVFLNLLSFGFVLYYPFFFVRIKSCITFCLHWGGDLIILKLVSDNGTMRLKKCQTLLCLHCLGVQIL